MAENKVDLMSQKTEIQKFKQGKKDAEDFIAETLKRIRESKDAKQKY